MSEFLDEQSIYCPYCGETIRLLVNYYEVEQDYIEDCQVCCRPIRILLQFDPITGQYRLSTLRDDE